MVLSGMSATGGHVLSALVDLGYQRGCRRNGPGFLLMDGAPKSLYKMFRAVSEPAFEIA
jgi:hypothetical protein